MHRDGSHRNGGCHGPAHGYTCACVHALSVWLLLAAAPLPTDLSISGRVQFEGGAPAAGAVVWVVCNRALPEGPPIDCGALLGTRGRKTQTDGEGRFVAEGLPRAVYTVVAGVKEPRQATVEHTLELRSPVKDLALTLKFPPDAGAPKRAEGLLTASVESADGFPVPNATLVAPRERTLTFGQLTLGMPPGEPFTLKVVAPGWAPIERTLTLEEGETRRLGAWVMTPLLPLRGVVLDQATRKPIPNAKVSVLAVGVHASNRTDGTFLVARLRREPLTLEGNAPGYARSTVLVPANSDEAEVLLGPGAGVTVKVSDAQGRPVAGSGVNLPPSIASTCQRTRPMNAVTDAGGTVKLPAGLKGFCLLMAGLPPAQVDPARGPGLEQFRWVTLTGSEELTVEFRWRSARSAVRLRGDGPRQALLFAGDAPSPAGLAALQNAGLPRAYQVFNGFAAGSPTAGGFDFEGLAPGKYTLAIQDARLQWKVQPVEVGEQDVTVAPAAR